MDFLYRKTLKQLETKSSKRLYVVITRFSEFIIYHFNLCVCSLLNINILYDLTVNFVHDV